MGFACGGIPPEVHPAYAQALRDPAHAHAICKEYRAAAALDREHDQADRMQGRRIACSLLALWSAGGPLGTWYAGADGPVALWQAWSDDVQGYPLNAGQFSPEGAPELTAEVLHRFFGATGASRSAASIDTFSSP
jgi:haloacetate dehalogenase